MTGHHAPRRGDRRNPPFRQPNGREQLELKGRPFFKFFLERADSKSSSNVFSTRRLEEKKEQRDGLDSCKRRARKGKKNKKMTVTNTRVTKRSLGGKVAIYTRVYVYSSGRFSFDSPAERSARVRSCHGVGWRRAGSNVYGFWPYALKRIAPPGRLCVGHTHTRMGADCQSGVLRYTRVTWV